MSSFRGVIIAESLTDPAVLTLVEITGTRVEKVSGDHHTPWLNQWTLHEVEIPAFEVETVAEVISNSIDEKHPGSWYADFKDEALHYIVFPHKIFRIDRSSRAEYDEAKRHGISLGIPEHQVDFHPDVADWER
jgi:hypothetical protein